MAMDYPNPIHWDEAFARESKFGGLVAPQSIAVALDYGHGGQPGLRRAHPEQPPDLRRRGMVVLRLPGSPGRQAVPGAPVPRLQGGRDQVRRARPCSRAATPSTRNQHGVLVARERSTAIRYLYEEAKKRGMFESQARRHQALDHNRAGRSRHGSAATGSSRTGWASRRISTK